MNHSTGNRLTQWTNIARQKKKDINIFETFYFFLYFCILGQAAWFAGVGSFTEGSLKKLRWVNYWNANHKMGEDYFVMRERETFVKEAGDLGLLDTQEQERHNEKRMINRGGNKVK